LSILACVSGFVRIVLGALHRTSRLWRERDAGGRLTGFQDVGTEEAVKDVATEEAG
jgi:hypothetical protein